MKKRVSFHQGIFLNVKLNSAKLLISQYLQLPSHHNSLTLYIDSVARPGGLQWGERGIVAGVWGLSPQWGPGAEQLRGVKGSPVKL